MTSSNSEVVGGDIDIDGLFTFHKISVPRLAGDNGHDNGKRAGRGTETSFADQPCQPNFHGSKYVGNI